MAMVTWIRRHRGLVAFAAGALVTLAALAAVVAFVLADQRRSARVLAATLSRALAREVRIERVTTLDPSRVVMRGVWLPREGGWPADVVAEQVEATGPLTVVARGEAAPVQVVVTRPTVTVAAAGDGGLALAELRRGIMGFLGDPMLLDLTLVGGRARQDGAAAEFDLTLRKASGRATGELRLRGGRGAALTVGVETHADGESLRLALEGRGPLRPLADWLPRSGLAPLGDRPLTLVAEVAITAQDTLTAQGRLAVGDALVAAGDVKFADGTLHATLPEVAADLAFAATLARLPWQPSGRAELSQTTVTWRPDAGQAPAVRTTVAVAGLALPADAGVEVRAERAEGSAAVEPTPQGVLVHGQLAAPRLRMAGLDVASVAARYRAAFDAAWTPRGVNLDLAPLSVEGAQLRGALGYDVATGRVDADLAGQEVEAAALVRGLLPGWLAPTDGLRVSGLRLAASSLDPKTLQAGRARLEARAVRFSRAEDQLAAGRSLAQVDLERSRIEVAVEADAVGGTLTGLRGPIPRLGATADLGRGADGRLTPRRADLAGKDDQGRDLVTATLTPASRTGRFALAARTPALERLGGLLPPAHRVNGSARLDLELGGPGFRDMDGRLALTVPEAELDEGKVTIRDLHADLPVRRGADAAAEPPWGRFALGELIGRRLVVRDLATPARVWKDRLSLNDLTYALYSGTGKGWSEVDFDPAGLRARGQLTGEGLRIEEFVSAYGIRGGTMTGLVRYDASFEYRGGRLALDGRFRAPEGGTVNIETLNRLLAFAESDPTGVVRGALQNLRAFDYKSAAAEVRADGGELRVNLSLQGRERFLIFPPKVEEINIRNMPLSFLTRQFPGI
jgi:hypothetical protein